jgi:hypothetical protein
VAAHDRFISMINDKSVYKKCYFLAGTTIIFGGCFRNHNIFLALGRDRDRKVQDIVWTVNFMLHSRVLGAKW